MSEYIVEPKSRADLRLLAYQFRKKLGLLNEIYFPIVELLDIMCELFHGFSYEIVPDSVFPSEVHGDTDIIRKHIRIKESGYEGAANGNGRDRMTIAHEIGHYLTLCICGFSFQRNFKGIEVPAYCSPEWQAKCFAGELMVAKHLTVGMDEFEIEEKCDVSAAAAEYQYRMMKKN